MRNKKIEKLTILSILTAACVAISVFDGWISSLIFPFLTGIKIGLANIITIIVLYKYGFKDGLIVVIIKSLIVGLLFSGITAFVIGGIASLISYLCMVLIKLILNNKVSMISVSFVGGIIHILSQLMVVSTLYKMGSTIYAYGVYLILISIITSIIIGVLSLQCYTLLEKIKIGKKENE